MTVLRVIDLDGQVHIIVNPTNVCLETTEHGYTRVTGPFALVPVLTREQPQTILLAADAGAFLKEV